MSNSVSGLPLDKDIPEGWIPVEAIVIYKALDESGRIRSFATTTGGLSAMEALGMCQLAFDTLRAGLGGSRE